MKFDIIHFKSPNSLFQIIQRICDFIFVILDEVFCVIAKIVQGFDGGPGSGLKPRRPNRILRLTFNPNGMRDVIAQRGKRVKDLEVALDLVNLIERDRSVTSRLNRASRFSVKQRPLVNNFMEVTSAPLTVAIISSIRTSCRANHCMIFPKRIRCCSVRQSGVPLLMRKTFHWVLTRVNLCKPLSGLRIRQSV